MKIPKAELDAILDEVNAALVPVLKTEVDKAAAKLAKAHPGEVTPPEVPVDASATKAPPDASQSAPADESKDSPPAPDASASAPDETAPDETAPEAPADDAQDSPEELQAAYASLPLEAQQMHYLACKAALIAAMGAGDATADDGDATADAGDATAGAPPAAPAMKGEMPADPNGEVEKSEKDLAIESLMKTVKDQEIAMSKLIDITQQIVERPVRKSISSIREVAPAAGAVDVTKLTKAEIKIRLRKVAEQPGLRKSDRERITSYYLGNTDLEGIKDLLTT